MKASRPISRRKFLRKASMTAAATGIAISNPINAYTAKSATTRKSGKHSWWVKQIDKPKL